MVAIHTDDQEITERSGGFQVSDMTDMQQIETAICSNQPLSTRAQLVAATAKFLKLEDFWAHSTKN
jgi:hypothetical protein